MQGDVLKYILMDKLDNGSLDKVRKLSKYHKKTVEDYVSKKTIGRINKRMTDILGEEWNKLKNIMEETGDIISGSFVLQCILNESWDKSD